LSDHLERSVPPMMAIQRPGVEFDGGDCKAEPDVAIIIDANLGVKHRFAVVHGTRRAEYVRRRKGYCIRPIPRRTKQRTTAEFASSNGHVKLLCE
jgi:hypothetical protein